MFFFWQRLPRFVFKFFRFNVETQPHISYWLIAGEEEGFVLKFIGINLDGKHETRRF